jgi:ribosomal protein S18 acetylase RimI-like enzyme
MNGELTPLRIGSAQPEERLAALQLVFSHMDAEDRHRHVTETLACEPLSPFGPFEGLIGAWRGDRLVGVIFSELAQDRTAILWLPRLVEDEPQTTAKSLCKAMWNLLAKHHISYAQSLLPTVTPTELNLLEHGGFGHLTNLLYLISQHNTFPTTRPETALDLQPYCVNEQKKWEEVFEATCVDTLDCASWQDARSSKDILQGYQGAETFAPSLWLLASYQQQPVGCVMLMHHATHNNMELQYLGLIPAMRGRGFGRQLARHAQWLAHCAGSERLILAVDAANKPAIQTYTALGFQTWQRRRLYVRPITPANHWHTKSEQFFHEEQLTEDIQSSRATVTN